jgi:hypothetical protein
MDIDSIAGLRSPEGSLISLYVDQGPGLSARVTDLLKPIRERSEQGPRNQMLSVRADAERLSSLTVKMARDPAAGFAVFAAGGDGILEVVPLSKGVGDVAVLGIHPYVRPLRVMRAPLHGVAVVMERSMVDIYELVDDGLVGPQRMESDQGKRNWGGFRGFDEVNVRQHAEEEVGHMLKAAAEWMFRRHQEASFDFVALGGHHSTFEAMVPHLHPYLAQLPRHTFVVDPNTLTSAEVLANLRNGAEASHHRHDEELVGSLIEAPHRGAAAALGTPSVLAGVNLKAVEHLVISGPFAKPGVECLSCGWLARSGDRCSSCQQPLVEVDDVFGPAIERVLEASGQVTQVLTASPLDTYGAGALLRFPI